MKIDITLGTRVSGPNTMLVQNQFTSGKHCRIFSDDAANLVYIEDLGSLNGTYVNGQQIVRYMITANDEIILGGNKGYKTTLGAILKAYEEQKKKEQSVNVAEKGKCVLPEPETIECLEMLRKIELDFQKAELDANDKLSSLTMIRIIPASAIAALTALAAIFLPGGFMVYVSGVGGAITVFVMLWAWKWTSKKSRKIKEAQIKMKENLHYSYACPGCRHSLVGRPWVVLSQDKVCPYCRKKLS